MNISVNTQHEMKKTKLWIDKMEQTLAPWSHIRKWLIYDNSKVYVMHYKKTQFVMKEERKEFSTWQNTEQQSTEYCIINTIKPVGSQDLLWQQSILSNKAVSYFLIQLFCYCEKPVYKHRKFFVLQHVQCVLTRTGFCMAFFFIIAWVD